MRSKPTPTIAIATTSTGVTTETFIAQHIERLPFQIELLTGYELVQTSEGADLRETRGLTALKRKLAKWQGSDAIENFRAQLIANHLQEKDVAVVVAEYGPTGCAISAACRIANVPLIVHFHGYDAYEREVLRKNSECYKALFKQSSAIVGVSTHMCEQLVRLGAVESKTHHVPYFVDTDVFEAIDPSANDPVFLAVGRFVEKKAPHLTLMAFEQVLKEVPEAKLHFVGEGVLMGAVKQLALALGIDRFVVFHGAHEHKEITTLMRKARCFVQHSVVAENGDREGTPVSILEAQASGLPVVATRHTGIKDVVLEHETGFLVDEFDVRAMASRMTLLADDPQLAGRLGHSAAKRIRTVFGKEQTLDKLTAIIRSVAESKILD